jgi:hypothetical protein
MVCVLPSLCVTVCTCCLVLSPGQHGGVVVIVVVVVVLGGGAGWLVGCHCVWIPACSHPVYMPVGLRQVHPGWGVATGSAMHSYEPTVNASCGSVLVRPTPPLC